MAGHGADVVSLPPTIEAIVREYTLTDWIRLSDEIIQRIAHEACRLQREADYQMFSDQYDPIERSPLVVSKP